MKMKQNTGRLHNDKGFTLIEVMIALVVLVIGVLGALSMQLMTIKGNSNSISISRSVHEGSAALDRAESLGYTSSGLSAGTGKSMSDLFGTYPDFEGQLTYDVTVMNANDIKAAFSLTHDDFTGAEAKAVSMTIVQTVAGKEKTITLQLVKIDI